MICQKDESKNEIFNITYGEGREVNNLIKILNHFPNLKTQYLAKEAFSPERALLIQQNKKII